MSTLASITYVHRIQYFSKGVDEQGPFYDVEYEIDDWANADDFVNALMGLGRTEPHRHELSANLTCTRAVATGQGRPTLDAVNGLPGFGGGAIIRATYRAGSVGAGGFGSAAGIAVGEIPHQIDASTPIIWCTQELDFEVETITHPTSTYKFSSDNRPLTTPLQVDIGITVMSLTFHRLPYMPMTRVRAARGKLNNAVFLGAAAECVLFRGAKTTRERNTDGTVTQKVGMIFVEREVSWNKFLRDDKLPYTSAGALNAASFDYVVDGSGNRRFGTPNLSSLILGF